MGAFDLIRELRGAGIFVRADGETLDISPVSALTDEIIASLKQHKPEILNLLKKEDLQLKATTARDWMLHYAGGETRDLITSPPSTLAEVMRTFPAAIHAEPMHDTPARSATATEARELRKLVSAIYDTKADRAEALTAALDDPDDALTCYRDIAKAQGINDPRTQPDASYGAKLNVGLNEWKPTRCDRCAHVRRPGSAQACTVRTDLPMLFGLLYHLPDDRGAGCESWQADRPVNNRELTNEAKGEK